jgi:hypothetical protein
MNDINNMIDLKNAFDGSHWRMLNYGTSIFRNIPGGVRADRLTESFKKEMGKYFSRWEYRNEYGDGMFLVFWI